MMREKILWVADHLRAVLLAVGVCAVFLFIALYFLNARSSSSADSAALEGQYAHWVAGREMDPEQLQGILNALDRTPDLYLQYDGKIAQQLLFWKEASLAEKLVARSLKRLQHFASLAPYRQFAETSLLISLGGTQKALQEAKKMQQTLLKDSQIFTINLLRIALLEKEVGTQEGELQAWNQLQESSFSPEENSREPGATLSDYIRHCKRKASKL